MPRCRWRERSIQQQQATAIEYYYYLNITRAGFSVRQHSVHFIYIFAFTSTQELTKTFFYRIHISFQIHSTQLQPLNHRRIEMNRQAEAAKSRLERQQEEARRRAQAKQEEEARNRAAAEAKRQQRERDAVAAAKAKAAQAALDIVSDVVSGPGKRRK